MRFAMAVLQGRAEDINTTGAINRSAWCISPATAAVILGCSLAVGVRGKLSEKISGLWSVTLRSAREAAWLCPLAEWTQAAHSLEFL